MLALALALGVAAAAAAPPGGAMKLTLLAAGEGGNACLDGTPFGYYVATNSSSADWVIDIAGGGWCTTAAKCLQRIDGASSNRLASSSGWGSIGGGNGITSDSVADNPVFASYNRVSFPYCDGSSFTSHREEPLPTPNGSKTALLHMRGKNNLRAAIASLKKHQCVFLQLLVLLLLTLLLLLLVLLLVLCLIFSASLQQRDETRAAPGGDRRQRGRHVHVPAHGPSGPGT